MKLPIVHAAKALTCTESGWRCERSRCGIMGPLWAEDNGNITCKTCLRLLKVAEEFGDLTPQVRAEVSRKTRGGTK